MSTITAMTPTVALSGLMKKYNTLSLTDLHKNIKRKTGANDDRELFYGSIFVQGMAELQKHDCLISLADEPWDIQMIDKTKLDRGEEPNHFNIQNVSLPRYPVETRIKGGENNFYQIVADFIQDKKIKKQYKGGLLVLHLGLNLQGEADIKKLRVAIRKQEQHVFEQIWITHFAKQDYSYAGVIELLRSDDEIRLFPMPQL